MTTLTALARSGTLLQLGPTGRAFLVGFFGTLAAGLTVLFSISIAVAVASAGKIMPGVQVAGVQVGGLDRAAAEARLRAELPSLTTGDVVLSVDGTTVRVPYGELGRGYRMDLMLDSAFAVARSGDLVLDAVNRIRILSTSTGIAAVSSGNDPAALDRTVGDLVARFAATPVDAGVAYDPGAGFTVSPASEGARLDADDLRQALVAALGRTDSSTGPLTLSTASLAPEVTTREATLAARQANRIISMPLSMRAGAESFQLDMAAVAQLISFGTTEGGDYGPVIDEAGVAALIEPLAAKVARAPRDASFEWGPNGVTGVIPAADGLELDVEGSVASIVETLRARAGAAVRRSAPLVVAVSAPALTTEAATAAAPQMRRISTWTTFYVPGEGNYWNANIHIPARDLDGLVLAPGEWFDFWDDIGPVTVERGYGYGGAIIGGRSVPNGALAGGICSTSTTLFNAAMRAGLEIGDRTNHYYYIDRYPVGLDATVFLTDTYEVNMTFRNDTSNPVVVRAYTGNGLVRFDMWGVPDGRTVTLSAPVTSNHRAARDTVVVNASLAPGTSRRVEYPHAGFHSVVTRTVRAADGDVLWTNVWESSYRPVNGITEVGSTPRPEPSASPSPDPSTAGD